eukprot:6478518-Amphidinium_carterae.1
MSTQGWGSVASLTAAHDASIAIDIDVGLAEIADMEGSTEGLGVPQNGWASVARLEAVAEHVAEEGVASQVGEECVLDMQMYAAPMKRRRGRPPQLLSDVVQTPLEHVAEDVHHTFVAAPVYQSALQERSGIVALMCEMGNESALTVPSNKTYFKEPLHGHGLVSWNAACLQACLKRVCKAGLTQFDVDADYVKIFWDYVKAGSAFHHASSVVKALESGIAPQAWQQKVVRVAASQWLFSKLQLVMLEQFVNNELPQEARVAYIDAATYDETPMKTRTSDPLIIMSDTGSLAGSHLDPSGGAEQKLMSVISTDAASTRILQLRHTYAMVLHVQSLGYLTLFLEGVDPLQAMQCSTGEVLAKCLLRGNASTQFSDNFQSSLRVVSSDKAAYNHKGEVAVLSARDKGRWQLVSNYCEVHACSRCFSKVYDCLFSKQLTGMIACSLSLRTGGAMLVFRQALKEVIMCQLQVLYGSCSVEASLYRQHALALMVSAGTNLLLNQTLLMALPNGDWRVKGKVQIYVPLALKGTINHKKLASTVTAGLLHVFCSKKPHLYVRHRWTGFEVSCEELSRMEMVHNLLSATWPVFQQKMASKTSHAKKVAKAMPANHDEGVLEALPQWPDDVRPTQQEQPQAIDTEEHQALAVSELTEKSRGPEEHGKDMERAAEFLAGQPWSMLVAMRLIMEPL